MRLFVANKWTEESNKLISYGCMQLSTRVIRRSQSSKKGFAFLILVKRLRKDACLESSPCCINFLSKVTTMLNIFHDTFLVFLLACKSLSLTRGSFPRSPTRIMDLALKRQFVFSGKASGKQEYVCMNNLGPINIISSIIIYDKCASFLLEIFLKPRHSTVSYLL